MHNFFLILKKFTPMSIYFVDFDKAAGTADPNTPDKQIEIYYTKSLDDTKQTSFVVPTAAATLGIGGTVSSVFLILTIVNPESLSLAIFGSIGMAFLIGTITGIIGAFMGQSIRETMAHCTKPPIMELLALSSADEQCATDSEPDIEADHLPVATL